MISASIEDVVTDAAGGSQEAHSVRLRGKMPRGHSSRSAARASTRAARAMGMQDAAKARMKMAAVVAAIIQGSSGETPKRKVRAERMARKERAAPGISPAIAIERLWRAMSERTLRAEAPSA